MKTPKLGQHFLTDLSVITQMVASAGLTRDDVVVEIGPGHGILTEALLATGAQVYAYEKDPVLYALLKKKYQGRENLRLFLKDIRDVSLAELPRPYKVAANIPYYLTGKLIRNLLESEFRPAAMILMVQKEVGERLTAGPGQSNLLQLTSSVFAEIEYLFTVGKDKFDPPPQVDSAVVKFNIRPEPLLPDGPRQEFFRLLKFAFTGKRKKLTNTLPGPLGLDKDQILAVLQKCQIPPAARPQSLGFADWTCFYDNISQIKP